MSRRKKVVLSTILLVLLTFGLIWNIFESMIVNGKYGIKVSVNEVTSTGVNYVVECTESVDESLGFQRNIYTIEKLTIIGWKKLRYIEGGGGFSMTLEGGNLKPIKEGKTYNYAVNWAEHYGELSNGIYRIKRNINKYEGIDEEIVGCCYVAFVVWD